VWSINSGKIESKLGDFPDFRCLRVLASSSGVKGLRILSPSDVGTFHRSDTSLYTSLVYSWFRLVFTSCEAMEFAELWHRREECLDLPVRLLMVLHALRLGCESQ